MVADWVELDRLDTLVVVCEVVVADCVELDSELTDDTVELLSVDELRLVVDSDVVVADCVELDKLDTLVVDRLVVDRLDSDVVVADWVELDTELSDVVVADCVDDD